MAEINTTSAVVLEEELAEEGGVGALNTVP